MHPQNVNRASQGHCPVQRRVYLVCNMGLGLKVWVIFTVGGGDMEERACMEKKERGHMFRFSTGDPRASQRQLSQHGQLETAAATPAGLLFSFGGTAASLPTIHPAISISFLSVLLRPEYSCAFALGEKEKQRMAALFQASLEDVAINLPEAKSACGLGE